MAQFVARGIQLRRFFADHRSHPLIALPDGQDHRGPDAHRGGPGHFLSGDWSLQALPQSLPLTGQRPVCAFRRAVPPAGNKEKL
jgi:hypothetical protein